MQSDAVFSYHVWVASRMAGVRICSYFFRSFFRLRIGRSLCPEAVSLQPSRGSPLKKPGKESKAPSNLNRVRPFRKIEQVPTLESISTRAPLPDSRRLCGTGLQTHSFHRHPPMLLRCPSRLPGGYHPERRSISVRNRRSRSSYHPDVSLP